MPTFGSAFSGCGAMDLGFERAGWGCAWRIEWDENCQRVLKRHTPDVPLFGDVSAVSSRDLSPVDAIIGGFPCTDISLCSHGSRANFDGPQSGLVRDFARIVQDLKPRFFVVENVPKLLKLWPVVEQMGLFDGYEVEGMVLDASHFGAYTRRKRGFFVGDLEANTDPKYWISRGAIDRLFAQEGAAIFSRCACPGKAGFPWKDLAPALLSQIRVRKLTPLEQERAMGLPDNWTEGFRDNVRYLMTGNAVAVPVAEEIAWRLKEELCSILTA